MTNHQVAQCSKCEAPIIWVITERGKKMPVDADPTDLGGFVLLERGEDSASPPLATHHTKVSGKVLLLSDRHDSHFATCPHADHFRTKKE